MRVSLMCPADDGELSSDGFNSTRLAQESLKTASVKRVLHALGSYVPYCGLLLLPNANGIHHDWR